MEKINDIMKMKSKFLIEDKMKSRNFILVIIFVIIAFAVQSCGKNSFTMTSKAMEPTIKNGEIITADLNIYTNQLPERMDIVLFHSPKLAKTDWLMRIVGLPGEVVSFDSTGLLIDGKAVNSPNSDIHYQLNFLESDSFKVVTHPYKIPEGEYYFLGDNVGDSYDSRFWGSIPKENIYGKVLNY